VKNLDCRHHCFLHLPEKCTLILYVVHILASKPVKYLVQDRLEKYKG